MPDFSLIGNYLPDGDSSSPSAATSTIRTTKSVDRFEKAITTTFFENTNGNLRAMLTSILRAEGISDAGLLLLFLTASANNELFDYLNRQVFFPALYSGRAIIKPEEVLACFKDLRPTEPALGKWSDYTLKLTASKYLTLLKKFGLLEGSAKKTIRHPFLSDNEFVFLIYWLVAVGDRSNILESKWFIYSFYEKDLFIDRIRQNRFSKYFSINFAGDRLKVEPVIDYKDIYNVISQPYSSN